MGHSGAHGDRVLEVSGEEVVSAGEMEVQLTRRGGELRLVPASPLPIPLATTATQTDPVSDDDVRPFPSLLLSSSFSPEAQIIGCGGLGRFFCDGPVKRV